MFKYFHILESVLLVRLAGEVRSQLGDIDSCVNGGNNIATSSVVSLMRCVNEHTVTATILLICAHFQQRFGEGKYFEEVCVVLYFEDVGVLL